MNKHEELRYELLHYWNEKQVNEMLEEYTKLVERATPKKYYNPPTQGYIDYDCPKCYKLLCSNERKSYLRFCPNCGQALDWKD